MEQLIRAFEELRNINDNYEINNDDINNYIDSMPEEKVCVPIIGKFSSGKSALYNALLGYDRMLKEDITPETAIPAEIVYTDGDSSAVLYFDTGECKEISLDEYYENRDTFENVKTIRLYLNNKFLGSIRDIMLVDMPGFESAIETHNKAIDGYVINSQAYLIAFPADDMILRSSIGNVLKELCIHDMPIYVVITKCDKVDDEILEEGLNKLKKDLKRYIGDREVKIALTSSSEGEVEQAREILCEIEENAEQIIENKYKGIFERTSNTTVEYLNGVIKNSMLTESEFAEKEESINNEMTKIAEEIEREDSKFDRDIAECINAIKSDVNAALNNSESYYTTMAANNQDISEALNSTVRMAVTESLKKRFQPIIEKYVKKVSGMINSDTSVTVGSVGSVNIKSGEGAAAAVSAAGVAGIAAMVILGPFSALVIGAVAGLIGFFAGNNSEKKKRAEAEAEISRRLRGEIFPSVINQVGTKVEMAIKEQVMEIREEVRKNIELKHNTMQKALDDVRKQKAEEEEKLKVLVANAQNDIENIKEIKIGLQG